MALSSASVFEVRPGAGNDNNGGGFVTGASGTDYSQQNSPQYALTGLASAGAGSTLLYASASADMVGNLANLVSGTNATTGIFQIASVSVGVSITFDRAVTTGVGASIVLNIGGAFATISAAYTVAVLGGMLIYVKASGTYTTTTAQTLTGSFEPPLRLIGYTTTRSDNGLVSWTTATNSIKLIAFGSGGPVGFTFENFTFTSTAGTPGDCFHAVNSSANGVLIKNCSISGFHVGIDGNDASADFAINNLVLESVEIKNSVSDGMQCTGPLTILDCAIHNNGGHGVFLDTAGLSTGFTAINSAFKSNGGSGISYNRVEANAACNVHNCVLGFNTASGLVFATAGGANLAARNNIFYGNGAYGINAQAAGIFSLLLLRNNAFGANTTANYHNMSADPTDITLTANPFTASGGTPPDLSLNSTAGGGTACKGAGLPLTLPFT